MRDLSQGLFLEPTEENIKKYREDKYLKVKYSLLSSQLVGGETNEDMKKIKEKVKGMLEHLYSGKELYRHKPEFKNIDLTEPISSILSLNLFEEICIVVIDEKREKILGYKSFSDSLSGNAGSPGLNREIMAYLLEMTKNYGTHIGIVHIHNHPDLINIVPSENDKMYWLMTGIAAKFIGVHLLDSMIVTDFDLLSMKQLCENTGQSSVILKKKYSLKKDQYELLDQIDPKLRYLWNICPLQTFR